MCTDVTWVVSFTLSSYVDLAKFKTTSLLYSMTLYGECTMEQGLTCVGKITNGVIYFHGFPLLHAIWHVVLTLRFGLHLFIIHKFEVRLSISTFLIIRRSTDL